MKKEIDNFMEKLDLVKNASKQLDKVVSDLLVKSIEKNDIDALLILTEILPKGYRGTRRVYEAIYRIQDSINIKDDIVI